MNDGGDSRIRTDDPLLAKQMLYQLSYIPTYLYTGTDEIVSIFEEDGQLFICSVKIRYT